MCKKYYLTIPLLLLTLLTFGWNISKKDETEVISSSDYTDLVSLFKEFREFQKPKIIDGVPDYTAAAMAEQKQGLDKFKKRLVAIDPRGWPIAQQVDYHIVRAEMNGLEFNHRVLRPWFRDPGFYSTIPRFEQTMYGVVKIPKLPVAEDKVEDFRIKLQAIPKILEQAKGNLTEAASDLALLAIRRKDREIKVFQDLTIRLAEHHPDLVPDAKMALKAIENFSLWIKENKSKMKASAGVGIKNYNWYLKNVQLLPYTWEESLVLVQREFERAVAFMKLEENKNRNLPPLEPATTGEENQRRFNESQKFLLEFLREEEIFTIPEYMVLKPSRSSRRPSGVRNFFQQCTDRDPLPIMPHDFVGHSLDAKRHVRDTRPIRGAEFLADQERRLLFIDAFRNEGLATGMEEILMHAGMLDQRPRSREITYILLAFRAVRAAADLKMHSNELTFKEATEYCAKWTPYGWAREDSDLIWGDLELYLRQPAYGISYLVGKVQLEKLLADCASQLGKEFSLRQFMDEFLAAEQIPFSLIRWEMTGLEDEIKKLW